MEFDSGTGSFPPLTCWGSAGGVGQGEQGTVVALQALLVGGMNEEGVWGGRGKHLAEAERAAAGTSEAGALVVNSHSPLAAAQELAS